MVIMVITDGDNADNDLAFDHSGCFSPVVDQVVHCAKEEQYIHYLVVGSLFVKHKYANANTQIQKCKYK